LYPNGFSEDEKDYVSIFLRCINEETYKNVHIMYLFVFRNYYDYSVKFTLRTLIYFKYKIIVYQIFKI